MTMATTPFSSSMAILELDAIEWPLRAMSASEIMEASVYPDFEPAVRLESPLSGVCANWLAR